MEKVETYFGINLTRDGATGWYADLVDQSGQLLLQGMACTGSTEVEAIADVVKRLTLMRQSDGKTFTPNRLDILGSMP